MNTVTLLSAMLLGSMLLNPGAARADPNQNNGAVAATVPSPPPGCIQGTGSLIPQKTARCAAFGRSYSGEDLRKTGTTSLGDALRMLDPAITVRR
jgi:hypothetical protein